MGSPTLFVQLDPGAPDPTAEVEQLQVQVVRAYEDKALDAAWEALERSYARGIAEYESSTAQDVFRVRLLMLGVWNSHFVESVKAVERRFSEVSHDAYFDGCAIALVMNPGEEARAVKECVEGTVHSQPILLATIDGTGAPATPELVKGTAQKLAAILASAPTAPEFRDFFVRGNTRAVVGPALRDIGEEIAEAFGTAAEKLFTPLVLQYLVRERSLTAEHEIHELSAALARDLVDDLASDGCIPEPSSAVSDPPTPGRFDLGMVMRLMLSSIEQRKARLRAFQESLTAQLDEYWKAAERTAYRESRRLREAFARIDDFADDAIETIAARVKANAPDNGYLWPRDLSVALGEIRLAPVFEEMKRRRGERLSDLYQVGQAAWQGPPELSEPLDMSYLGPDRRVFLGLVGAGAVGVTIESVFGMVGLLLLPVPGLIILVSLALLTFGLGHFLVGLYRYWRALLSLRRQLNSRAQKAKAFFGVNLEVQRLDLLQEAVRSVDDHIQRTTDTLNSSIARSGDDAEAGVDQTPDQLVELDAIRNLADRFDLSAVEEAIRLLGFAPEDETDEAIARELSAQAQSEDVIRWLRRDPSLTHWTRQRVGARVGRSGVSGILDRLTGSQLMARAVEDLAADWDSKRPAVLYPRLEGWSGGDVGADTAFFASSGLASKLSDLVDFGSGQPLSIELSDQGHLGILNFIKIR